MRGLNGYSLSMFVDSLTLRDLKSEDQMERDKAGRRQLGSCPVSAAWQNTWPDLTTTPRFSPRRTTSGVSGVRDELFCTS
jgi:hypothetical protein